MALTPEQFARAAAFEAHQERLARLQRMSYRELQVLLTGDPEEAAVWVHSAAEYGVPAAQLRLGRMLLEGHGGATSALPWCGSAGPAIGARLRR